MSNPRYALKKLSQAIHELTIGAGPIRDRLHAAAEYVIQTAPEDMPDERSRLMLTKILEDLTKKEPKHKEGRVGATLRRMKTDTAMAIAQRIVELHARLED